MYIPVKRKIFPGFSFISLFFDTGIFHAVCITTSFSCVSSLYKVGILLLTWLLSKVIKFRVFKIKALVLRNVVCDH